MLCTTRFDFGRPLRQRSPDVIASSRRSPDLEVTIVSAMPLIDILSDLDLAAIETNSAELLDAVLVHGGLRLERCMACSSKSRRPHQCRRSLSSLNAQDPSHPSAAPELPYGMFGQDNCGSFRRCFCGRLVYRAGRFAPVDFHSCASPIPPPHDYPQTDHLF
jgi:hypothetical protein